MLVIDAKSGNVILEKGTDVEKFLFESNPLAAWQSEVSGEITEVVTDLTISTGKPYVSLSVAGHEKPAKMLVVTAVMAKYKKDKQAEKLVKGFNPQELVGNIITRTKRKTSITEVSDEVEVPVKKAKKAKKAKTA